MAVANLTPDSFSGDGITDATWSVARMEAAVAVGADIVDIGGESSRPGALPVPADEELKRILPFIALAAGRIPVPISVDTRKASVAEAAVARGARIINDVSGLADADMAPVAGRSGSGLVLVSSRHVDPGCDPIAQVTRDLWRLTEKAVSAGVGERNIVLDPGLGFGKTWRVSLEIVRRLGELRGLGFPLLVGPSRKGTIGRVLGVPVEQRLEGTAALVCACIAGGADVVRAHDIRPMVRVARMTDALARG